MSTTALLLVLGAGLLHASWNLLFKQTEDRLLVAAWGLLVGAAVFSPALAASWPPPVRVWPYAAGSALVLLAYYAFLARAYERGDFSLVYPVARGTAPAMLVLWAALFLGERPSPLGLLGIATILAGLVVLGGAPLWSVAVRRRGRASRWAAVRSHASGAGAAFLVAFLVSAYSAIDGAAVRHWSPLPYLVLVFALSGSALVPWLALREARARRGPGPSAVLRVLRAAFPRVAAIAVMTLGAYSLVLTAFQIAPVSYVGAARESGIVFGALAGWLLLGERFGAVRAAGAALVFAGIGLLAAAK